MGNRYHFLFKTPEPNLVEGMKWFQNAWTRRFNSRHRLWGHLFGGRYKAILVEEGGWRKGLAAGLIRRRSLVDNGWLTERLHMGARNAVSRTIRMADEHIKTSR